MKNTLKKKKKKDSRMLIDLLMMLSEADYNKFCEAVDKLPTKVYRKPIKNQS